MSRAHTPPNPCGFAPQPGAELEVEITRLGTSGDGEAVVAGRKLFVPFTAPGERWRVRVTAVTTTLLRAEPVARLSGQERAEPICRHFGTCGGCALQHLPLESYRAFKSARIRAALARERLEVASELPLVSAPLASRRRVRLAFAAARDCLTLGFRARRSHRVIAIEQCPIARPELAAVFAPLRAELARLALVRRAGSGEVALTLVPQGLDLVLIAAQPPAREDREALAQLARALDLARLSWAAKTEESAEVIAVRRAPLLRFGAFSVAPPPGVFLQATKEGEQALQAAVQAWVPAGARLVDLFAGTGALSLPLADRLARLLLVERDSQTVMAVRRAVAGSGHIAVETRDLERRPLDPSELAGFDVALLDPPRAGALSQCRALARASIARLIYASCAPESFARDARLLVDAGFRITALQPIDQFLFSPEVELIALFERASPRRPDAS